MQTLEKAVHWSQNVNQNPRQRLHDESIKEKKKCGPHLGREMLCFHCKILQPNPAVQEIN